MVPANKTVPDFTEQVLNSIKNSKIPLAQKGLLITEWTLRNFSISEIYDMTPKDIVNLVQKNLSRFLQTDLEDSLNEIKKAFPCISDENVYNFITALAYFLYVTDEFVYDHKTRTLLLTKENDFDLSIDKAIDALKSWKDRFGDPVAVFRRIIL